VENLSTQRNPQSLPWSYQKWLPLSLNEADYYYLHSQEPSPPTEGYILVKRLAYSNVIKIIYPVVEGETVNQSVYIANDSPYAHLKMVKAGIPQEKLERTLDYLSNFNKAYVATPHWRPTITPRDTVPKESTKSELVKTLKEAILLLAEKEK
jgi:hypothetical protein